MEIVAFIAVIAVALVAIFAVYFATQVRFERKFREWQQAESLKWQEDKARALKGAVAQSRAILGGKFTEQMVPFLPDFKYDPTEARFIGSPIDLIVFPGLAQGDPREIVIVEIKTGKAAHLTGAERKIQQLIEAGMVRWELIQRPGEEST